MVIIINMKNSASGVPANSAPIGRQSNIELLRIIAAIGVIVLHYNNADLNGAFGVVPSHSLGAYFLYFLEALFIGSVDMFMMIFGRFQAGKKEVRIEKIVFLLLQVSIVHVVYYLTKVLFFGTHFTVIGLVRKILPSNYFIVTYCVVLALSPFINKLLDSLKSKKQLLIILLFCFSVFPACLIALDFFTGISLPGLNTIAYHGSGKGYTALNYILMYIIGASTKDLKLKRSTCVIGMIVCFLPQLGLEFAKHLASRYPDNIHSYCSPFVIGFVFFTLMFFTTLDIGIKKPINFIAGGSLMVYLTHQYFIPLFKVSEYAFKGGVTIIIHLTVTCILLYTIGLVLSLIYTPVTKPLYRKISSLLKGKKITAQ